MALPKKPRLLYEISIERRRYFQRFARTLLITVAAFGALVALNTALEQGAADSTLLVVGIIIAAAATTMFALRAAFSLWRGLRRKTETVRIFDQGLVWTRAGQEAKYGWSALQTYRLGGHGLYWGKRVLLQWGAHTLKMRDGRVFRLSGIYGDLRTLASAVGRQAAHVTGIAMGKTLREEHPVKLHRRLTVWPGGIQVDKQEIPWSEVDVRLKGGQLTVFRKTSNGKFRTVRRYRASQIENVGGFMEVASITIRNHQRERFGV